VGDIAVQVIERHLLHELWNVFSPISVLSIPDEAVSAIAGEAPKSQNRRHSLEMRREMLTRGLKVCQEALPGALVDTEEQAGCKEKHLRRRNR
jgi:hypothetical protein